MDDDGRLRVGPWVPAPEPVTGRPAPPGPAEESVASGAGHAADGPRPDWLDLVPARQPEAGGTVRRRRAIGGRALLVAVIVALVAVPTVVVVRFWARSAALLPRPLPIAGQPSAPAGPGPSQGPGVGPSAGPSPTVATRPALAPVTYEAEAAGNTVTGSAHAGPYPGASGGRLVRTIGNWGSPQGNGTLRFNGVVVPAAGLYDLTFYFVHPNNEPTRSVVVTVSGFGPVVVTASGSAACCGSQTVRVMLNSGANSITFGNPSGHAPSIDRIVLSAP